MVLLSEARSALSFHLQGARAERGLAIFEKGQIAENQEKVKKLETFLETERVKTQKLSERVEALATMLTMFLDDKDPNLIELMRSHPESARARVLLIS